MKTRFESIPITTVMFTMVRPWVEVVKVYFVWLRFTFRTLDSTVLSRCVHTLRGLPQVVVVCVGFEFVEITSWAVHSCHTAPTGNRLNFPSYQ